MQEMWSGFSDWELAEIAAQYNLQDELDFNLDLTLMNRARIETLLTQVELEMAFGE
jgi:hypothetical protein